MASSFVVMICFRFHDVANPESEPANCWAVRSLGRSDSCLATDIVDELLIPGPVIWKVAKKWPSGFGCKKANECKSLAKMAARVGIEPTTK